MQRCMEVKHQLVDAVITGGTGAVFVSSGELAMMPLADSAGGVHTHTHTHTSGGLKGWLKGPAAKEDTKKTARKNAAHLYDDPTNTVQSWQHTKVDTFICTFMYVCISFSFLSRLLTLFRICLCVPPWLYACRRASNHSKNFLAQWC